MHTYTHIHKWSYSQMHSLAHSSFRFVRVCPFAEPLLIFTCLFFNFVNISRSIGQWKCQNIQQTLSHLHTHTHTHMYSYMDVRMHVCVSSFLSNSFIPKSYKMHHKCRVCVYMCMAMYVWMENYAGLLGHHPHQLQPHHHYQGKSRFWYSSYRLMCGFGKGKLRRHFRKKTKYTKKEIIMNFRNINNQ